MTRIAQCPAGSGAGFGFWILDFIRHGVPIASLALISGSGCLTSSPRTASLDREFDRVWVEPEPDTAGSMAVLSAKEAVRLALAHSRSLEGLKDLLRNQTLMLRETRRGLAWDASLEAEWLRNQEGEDESSGSLTAGDTLATGAEVSLRGLYDPDDVRTGEPQGSTRLRLEQPLLRGAGHAASHEALVQGERTLRYQVRGFELERENLLLAVLDSYYDLIDQTAVLENVRRNLEQARFLRQRSEEVFAVQKATYLDVLRAQQQELQASNRYANAAADVRTSRRAFLVQIGLDPDREFEIEEKPPGLRLLQLGDGELERVALAWRRELSTSRERVEDAERRLDLAENARLPSLGVFGQAEGYLEENESDENALSGGVSLSVPLQRGGPRDGVVEARIALAAARRDLIDTEADIRIELLRRRNQLRNYHRDVLTQRRNVAIAERRLEFAVIRFEDGTLPNRDVVEAQDELLGARNALVRALVDHELERLRLLKSAGCLRVMPDGGLQARPVDGMVWFTDETMKEPES